MARRREPRGDPDRLDEDLDLREDSPEPTARPSERQVRERAEEDDEKLVPLTNVGGAAPTPLGLDSGGNFPGGEDDLANLSEPEPPDAPEVDAVHVRDDEDVLPPKRNR
jgi:hypothetical protein